MDFTYSAKIALHNGSGHLLVTLRSDGHLKWHWRHLRNDGHFWWHGHLLVTSKWQSLCQKMKIEKWCQNDVKLPKMQKKQKQNLKILLVTVTWSDVIPNDLGHLLVISKWRSLLKEWPSLPQSDEQMAKANSSFWNACKGYFSQLESQHHTSALQKVKSSNFQ